jgi:F0F1-type ATP synthase assembly protein I
MLALGMAWASRIMTLAMEILLPAVLGVGLDRWWNSRPLFTLVGCVLGFLLFMFHMLKMSRELSVKVDGAPGQAGKDEK